MSPDLIHNARYRQVLSTTFAADSALDADLFVTSLAPDATFRLGGAPPVTGRENIRHMVTETFKAFESVSHVLRAAYELDTTFIYEADVTYAFAGGRRTVVPYVHVLQFRDDLVSDYRIYLDLSSLIH